MCDLCFKPIFDREFYVFPCQHAFHRMCIQNRLMDYDTKDVRVRVTITKVKACFEHIENIKKNAMEISSQTRGPNAGSMSGMRNDSSMYDPERSQSYLNDITSIAGGLIQKGANLINQSQLRAGMGGINQQQMVMLREKEESQIRAKLEEVDEILTRECFFCGGILIDMIDNDIEVLGEDDDQDDAEVDDGNHNDSSLFFTDSKVDDEGTDPLASLKDEWDIK